MNSPAPQSLKARKAASGLTCAVLLGAILLILFFRSFRPDEVLFSNDGPYGAMVAEQNRMPGIVTGLWQDLNWLGDQVPSPSPTVSSFLRLITSPAGFSKIFYPAALFVLGMCAWFCFREWNLSRLACTLGALAAAFSSHFLSAACWGVAAQVMAFGMCFVAIGLAGNRSGWKFWVRLVVAGMAVGINIMEGYDIGAIFSLFVAGFIFYESLIYEPSPARGALKGILEVGIVAGFAAICAAQALTVLIGTQIKGITDEKGKMTPEQKWDWATQWSMPPAELPRIFISGLYGYRMDTPEGGAYWGKVGETPMLEKYLEEYHARGNQGVPPNIPAEAFRFNGGGEYAGVIVVLVAIWAILQSFRKTDSAFTQIERKFIWFWAGAALVSLLLATGRYAPFYRLFYLLPHASDIRNASKFMHPFHWSLVILFAYGIHGINKRYFSNAVAAVTAVKTAVTQKRGWVAIPLFDRRWLIFLFVLIGASLIGWLAYASSHDKLVKHLMDVGFGNEGLASQMASFSIKEVGWFVLFLILSVALLTAIFTGRLTGPRAKLGAILLGALLLVDLARADLPWIIYQNYVKKYASNPVIDLLREKPYEHRVAIFPMDRFIDLQHLPPEAKPLAQLYSQLAGLYRVEWQQHHFQYYNIQALEDVQRPREAAEFKAYERGPLAGAPFRHWELTNTKYFLAPAALRGSLQPQGFGEIEEFNLQPKPGVSEIRAYEDMTAVPATNGQYAVFEFTNSLPRAKLYANWQVNTNDEATLNLLASTNFNPHESVILASPISLTATSATNQNPGSVRITDYAPKRIVLSAKPTVPSVFLVNDKYDPNWKVTVDGKPQTLLRANYIMRAVALTPGDHTIEFRFKPPLTSLYVSLAAIVVGLALVGVLVVVKNGDPPATPTQTAAPPGAKKEK